MWGSNPLITLSASLSLVLLSITLLIVVAKRRTSKSEKRTMNGEAMSKVHSIVSVIEGTLAASGMQAVTI